MQSTTDEILFEIILGLIKLCVVLSIVVSAMKRLHNAYILYHFINNLIYFN